MHVHLGFSGPRLAQVLVRIPRRPAQRLASFDGREGKPVSFYTASEEPFSWRMPENRGKIGHNPDVEGEWRLKDLRYSNLKG